MMSLFRTLAMAALLGGAIAVPSMPADARAQGRPGFGGYRGPVGGPVFRAPGFGVRPGYYPGYRAPYYGGGWGYRPYYRPYYGWGYGGYPWWGWAPLGLGLGLGLAWAWPWYAPPAYPAYGAPPYGYPPPYAQPAYPYGAVEPSYPPGTVQPGAPPATAWPGRGANAAICQAGPVTCGMPTAMASGQPCSCPSPAGAVWGFAQ